MASKEESKCLIFFPPENAEAHVSETPPIGCDLKGWKAVRVPYSLWQAYDEKRSEFRKARDNMKIHEAEYKDSYGALFSWLSEREGEESDE